MPLVTSLQQLEIQFSLFHILIAQSAISQGHDNQEKATKRKIYRHLASPQLATIFLTAVTRIVAKAKFIRIRTDQGHLAGVGTADDCPLDDEQSDPDFPIKNQPTMPLRCHCRQLPCFPPETDLNGQRRIR
jgi:hypothetical protein